MSQVVIGDILPYTQATAIASQTVFGTNWTVNALTDVVVYQTPSGSPPDDVTQILTTSQYSVSLIGSQQEVQVTLVSGASAGDIITITRQTPADRENLYSNTNFTPSMLNNDFGILTLVDQQAQLVNQLIGPRYNYSAEITDVVDTILPILPENMTWVKNANNTAIETYYLPPGGVAPADATYVLLSPNGDLANAFALNSIGQGILVNIPGTPILTVTTVLGTTNQITVANGDGTGGNIGISITTNPIMPGTGSMGIPTGSTAQRPGTPQDGWFRYNTSFHLLEYYSTPTASWVQVGDNGAVAPGLINELAWYSVTGNTVSGLATAANGVLVTSSGSVPSISSTLPSGLTIPLPIINQIWGTNGFPVAIFTDVASTTDYFEFLTGTSNQALMQLISTNTNASFRILAKGTGGVEIGSTGATATPLSLTNSTNTFGIYIPSWTGNHTLTLPDANVTLVSGTMLSNALTSADFFVGNGSNVATGVAMSGDAALANTGAVTVSKIGGVGISLAGAFTTTGAYTVDFTFTGNTGVTFPTSGTLATTTGTVTNATNAANVGTTAVSNNANYFPLMVASSSNSNQAPDLVTSLTFNASTGALAGVTAMSGLTGYLSAPAGLKDSSGNIMLSFVYNATPTDYLVIENGVNNGAGIYVSSSDTNASISITAKGTGGVAINPGGTATVPLTVNYGAYNVGFNVGALTQNISLTFPDASVTLVGGTVLVNGGALGTPSGGTLTNCTGLPIAGTTGWGTGVATALAINVGSAGAPVLFNGAGGTPSSMTGTNITGTAAGLTAGTASAVAVGGITGLGTGVATALAVNASASGGLPVISQGSWTPTDGSGASLTFSTATGYYTQIGNVVFAWCEVVYPSTASGAGAGITGLPFTCANSSAKTGGVVSYSTAATLSSIYVNPNSTVIIPWTAAGAQLLNSALSLATVVLLAIYSTT